MEPQQLAALLGTEIDSGFAAALSRLGASRALVVETIRTRVGALPDDDHGETVDWSQIPWVADVTLLPVEPQPVALSDDEDTHPRDPGAIPGRIATLPVSAIRGVGRTWVNRLTSWGIDSVGDLAAADPSALMARAGARAVELVVLLSRARTAVGPWPQNLPAGKGASIASLATGRPDSADVPGFVLREHCMSLVAALDLDIANSLRIP